MARTKDLRTNPWGGTIWGMTRPYPFSGNYAPGYGPGVAPPPPLPPPNVPRVNLPPPLPGRRAPGDDEDDEDELTDEERVRAGLPPRGNAVPPAPVQPPPGPQTAFQQGQQPGAWQPGEVIPEGWEIDYAKPIRDQFFKFQGYLLKSKKPQAANKMETATPEEVWQKIGGKPFQYPGVQEALTRRLIGGKTYPFKGYYTPEGKFIDYGELLSGEVFPSTEKPAKPGGVNQRSFTDEAGTRTYAVDDAGNIIPGTWHYTPKEKKAEPVWQKLPGTSQEYTLRPGGIIPGTEKKDKDGNIIPGTGRQHTGPATVIRVVLERDEQGEIRTTAYPTKAGETLSGASVPTGTEAMSLNQLRLLEARQQGVVQSQQEKAEEARSLELQAQAAQATAKTVLGNPRRWVENAMQGGTGVVPTPPFIARLTGQRPGAPLGRIPPRIPLAQEWADMDEGDKQMLMGYLEWLGINTQQWLLQLSQTWGAGQLAPQTARLGIPRQR